MQYFMTFEKHRVFNDVEETKKAIMNLKKLPNEYKEAACKLIHEYSVPDGKGGMYHGIGVTAEKGRVSGLNLHPDLIAKIKKLDLKPGFSMGVDKNGYYIHTHRARSKSHPKPDGFSAKEIKFIESTG